jgi:hypothetical protein
MEKKWAREFKGLENIRLRGLSAPRGLHDVRGGRAYRIGPFILDTANKRLSKEDETIPCAAKPFELLTLLEQVLDNPSREGIPVGGEC